MRAGVLQQVDTPRELYTNPKNLFVAGFIGSPAMNFFAGSVEGDQIKLPFASLPLPDGVSASGAVIAGIRPEDFEDASLAPDGGTTFEVPIELVENMGSELYAHFSFSGGAAESDQLAEIAADAGTADVPSASGDENVAVARLSPESQVKEGEKATPWLDPSKLHLFDPSDGTNLRQS
jgi:multiple sugar transport system ATP-binding protein